MTKKVRAYFLILLIALTVFTSLTLLDPVFAEAPEGYETYHMRGYAFNIPDSFKLVDEGFDDVNHFTYLNFKKGKNFVNISIEKHSYKYNRNIMDTFAAFTLNGLKHYKKTISGVTGFYIKKKGIKSFIFSSSDDMIYIKLKGVKVSKVVSSIKQKDYKPKDDSDYDWDDDAYYESDVYDDSFDDSFDDKGYYSYDW